MLDKITLITGLIGSGKTLRAVWYIDQEIKAGRAVYVCNLEGLNIPGAIPWDDPRDWQQLPPGSLLVVDEAQKFWRARRSGDPPKELQDAETSRHDAVSMLLLTQQPTYLDKHLRGLVTRHEHLFRRMGAPGAQLFVWERCIDDPMSPSERDHADQSMFVYPKHLFSAYKSAEKHTTKVRLPLRAKLIIAALLVVGLLVWNVFGKDDPAPTASLAGSGAGAGAAAASAGPGAAIDAEGYLERFKPRVDAMPFSAPAWDERPVVSDPQIVCMIGERLGCQCLTEQGTDWEMDQVECVEFVEAGGVYNPFKQPERERRQEKAEDDRERDRPRASGRAVAQTTGAGAEEVQQSSYGGFRP